MKKLKNLEKIQCFRHGSEKSLEERASLKEKMDFLITYGLAILTLL